MVPFGTVEENEMILLVSLGNTSLTFSLYEERNCRFLFKTYTDKLKSENEYMDILKSFFLFHQVKVEQVEGALLSSVVPSLTKRIQRAIENVIQKDCMLFNRELKTSIAIRTDHPQEVGSDLLSLAVGAINTYQRDVLIINMSSVLSFSIATAKREFLGATFFPGMRESVSNMVSSSAQLMEIDLEKPKRILGKNTKESINSGMMNGYKVLISNMADELEKEYGKELYRVITGSDAKIVKDILGHTFHHDHYLLFDGLYDIYMKNKGAF